MNHHIIFTVLISVLCVAALATTITLVGYFTNWFQFNTSREDASNIPINDTSNIPINDDQLTIQLVFEGGTGPVSSVSGTYTKLTNLDNVNIQFQDKSYDELVATFDQSEYVGAWSLLNSDDQTRHFVIIQNTTNFSEKPFIAAIGSASDNVTFYAFGDSTNPFDYGVASDVSNGWVRRLDGSSPNVYIY